MIHSMTAFASRTGTLGPIAWVWEVRGVNGRGLDLRLRLPDGIAGLEQAVRAALGQAVSRGNVTVSLRITREDTAAPMVLDETQLDQALRALDQIQERAFTIGVTLGQPTAADVLSQRGIMVSRRTDDDDAALAKALIADLAPLTSEFVAMRASEGRSLASVLQGQLDEIARLTHAAKDAAEARAPKVKQALTDALRRALEDVAEVDEARVAQELAMLAVKSDVTEEIDRLTTHVAAAKLLLEDGGPSGRKLDFLAQEFNREANTLCAKAQDKTLTAIGLELKAVIDQMREQIQNVE